MDLDWYRIKPLQPLPSTPIYQTMIAQGLIDDTDPQGGALHHRRRTASTSRWSTTRRPPASEFRRAIEALPDALVPSRA